MSDFAAQVSNRLSAAAEQAGMSPLDFLRDGMSGTSADGSVRVWVDGLGRVQRVQLAPGSVYEGDEQRLAAAFTEAAKAAAGAIADLLAPDSVGNRQQPARAKPARQEEDDAAPVIRA